MGFHILTGDKKPDNLNLIDGLGYFPMDIETYNLRGFSALDYYTGDIRCCQFSIGKEFYFLDFMKYTGSLSWFFDILENQDIVKVIHNAPFEYKYFYCAKEIEIRNLWCTLVAERTIYNGIYSGFGYGDVVYRHFNVELDKEIEHNWHKPELTKKDMKYAFNDVIYLGPLYRLQRRKIKQSKNPKLESLLKFEMKVMPDFIELELNGVTWDKKAVEEAIIEQKKVVETALQLVQESLGVMLPLPDSMYSKVTGELTPKWKAIYPDGCRPPATRDQFIEAMEIKGIEIPKAYDKQAKKYRKSLSKDTFHLLDHPCGLLIQEYNAQSKLLTTYLENILGVEKEVINKKTKEVTTKVVKESWIHKYTKRSHPSYNQVGAVTGRPTVKDPPLQTMPKLTFFRKIIKAGGGRPIKKKWFMDQYINNPGDWKIMKADYSQMELRVGSVIAPDRVMQNAFKRGEDIHTLTASLVLGVPREKVTGKDRQNAKAVNFGLIFGQYAKGFREYARKEYGVDFTLDEAKQFRDRYLETYKGIDSFQDKVRRDTLKAAWNGKTYYAETIMGRRKYTLAKDAKISKKPWVESDSDNMDDYSTYCNDDINYPIQGSASESLKKATYIANRLIEKHRVRAFMILQVHDELVFEYHQDDQDKLAKIVVYAMKKAGSSLFPEVPIEVELCVGKNWGETETIFEG